MSKTPNNMSVNKSINLTIGESEIVESSESSTFDAFTIFGNKQNIFIASPPLSPSGSLISVISLEHDANRTLSEKKIINEEWWLTTLQVSIPFLIAGIGTIGAGILLGVVEQWTVFKAIRELFILVPALIGLKGNLDMCLASRLSTQANLGNMTGWRAIMSMVFGNIALVQVYAIVCSFIVAIFAITVGSAMNNVFVLEHAVLMVASSMFTATVSCLILDFVLVAVIIISHKLKLNPDNLATPLAASIGDVVSLTMLSFIASTLYENIVTYSWLSFMILSIYTALLPFWIICVIYNQYTKPILKTGWVPVLSALFISGLGGLVLDQAVDAFTGFVVFQPIINGIGGNLVSVQASKISTFLHQSTIPGIVPPHTKIFENPLRALVTSVPYGQVARILILMSIPGQLIFIFVADAVHMGHSTLSAAFVFSYMFASLLLICLLLYIAHVIIHAMWRWKMDPDNSAIPYLTALGDLFGSMFLALAFLFIQSVGFGYGEHVNE